MSAQLRLIRSRYKTMCASLGVRARLQPALLPGTREDGPDGAIEGAAGPAAAAGLRGPDADADADAGAEKRGKKKIVWPFAGPAVTSASPQSFSF